MTMNGTDQELLADRRANALEAARETDLVARQCLETYIALIDAELQRRALAREAS